ncbi:MAG TPA: hypothetical protein VF771_18800 [Longimicrobiaceae bacterium]
MQKLRLDVDTLQVESFDPEAAAAARGTAFAHDSGYTPDDPCYASYDYVVDTCLLTCGSTCGNQNTCWDTCGASCGGTCGLPCRDTGPNVCGPY